MDDIKFVDIYSYNFDMIILVFHDCNYRYLV